MRHCLSGVLISSLLLWAPTAFGQGFTEITLEAPAPLIQPPLTANLLPGGGDELVLFTQTDGARQIYIYQWQDEAFVQRHQLQLPAEYISYDLTSAEADGEQQLYFLAHNQLASLRIEGDRAHIAPRVAIANLVRETRPAFIYRNNFLYPLNERHEPVAIIPDFSTVQVITQLTASKPRVQRLPVPANIIMENRGASYTPPALYVTDINQDAAADIIWPGEGSLRPFIQDDTGTFSAADEIALATDIRGIDWWYQRDERGEGLDQSDLTYRKLEQVKDINQDGKPDLVVRYTRSQGVLDRANDYEVYLGQTAAPDETTLTFNPSPDSVVRAQGTLTDLKFVDIQGDGRPEILLSGFNIGLTQIIGALLSGSIDQQVYLFAQDEAGNYGEQPAAKEQVALKFSLTSGRSGSAVTLLADITGDGIEDLVLSKGSQTLEVYEGLSGAQLMAKKPAKFKAPLPEDGSQLRAADITGNQKADLILSYGKLDDPKLLNTIKLLITK